MRKVLGAYHEPTYAVMRVVLGALYLSHGLQKLFGVFNGQHVPAASLLGAAGIIEIICGTLIVLGLFTSWAAFVASGEMAFAYFLGHMPRGGFPIENGGELAVALCFAFLYVAAHGGGRWSIDRAFHDDLRRFSPGRRRDDLSALRHRPA